MMGRLEIVTDVVIEASVERVWQVLTCLAAYPGWNPVLRRVQGQLAVEQRLTVIRIGARGREVVERPTVTWCRPMREIRWRARLGLPWLLDTERSFEIERLGPDRVRFVHRQSRSGVLAFLQMGTSQTAARDQLEVMNLALKARVEHGATTCLGPRSEHRTQQGSAAPEPPAGFDLRAVAPPG